MPSVSKSKLKNADVDVRMNFTAAINDLSKNIKNLLASKDRFEELTKEGIEQNEAERQAQEQSLKHFLEEIQEKRRRHELDLELQLQRNSYETACRILAERDEVPISNKELTKMKETIANSQTTMESQVKEAVDSLRKQLSTSNAVQLKYATLEHEKGQAELMERNKALNSQIEQLMKTISELRQDVVNSQNLVRSVAEASSRPISFSAPPSNTSR